MVSYRNLQPFTLLSSLTGKQNLQTQASSDFCILLFQNTKGETPYLFEGDIRLAVSYKLDFNIQLLYHMFCYFACTAEADCSPGQKCYVGDFVGYLVCGRRNVAFPRIQDWPQKNQLTRAFSFFAEVLGSSSMGTSMWVAIS